MDIDIDNFLDFTQPIPSSFVPRSSNNENASQMESAESKRPRVNEDYTIALRQDQNQELLRREDVRISQAIALSKDPPIENVRAKIPATGLGIARHREKITEKIRTNPILIITAETGMGKSSQVPQFILDDALARDDDCRILVTQPRRIAARSLATHVSKERGCEVGTEVGYQVSLEPIFCDETKILYCTNGVALEKLVKAKNMKRYSHIILDEVHERDQDMEFLYILIKKFLCDELYSTRIILMSATLDYGRLREYFKFPVLGDLIPAPVLNLRDDREFSLDVKFLDDLKFLAQDIQFDKSKPGISGPMYTLVHSLIRTLDSHNEQHNKPRNGVLVFLPGIFEIRNMERVLKSNYDSSDCWDIQVLHSSISSDVQKLVFRKPAMGRRKIILATNMAESSITIPDIEIVIDFCLTKLLEADNSTGFSTLRLAWASKNSCTQRAGRAGRTMPGRAFHLVYKKFYDDCFEVTEMPALLRCSLEKVVLKSKMLDFNMKPHEVLGLAMDPPVLEDIQKAVLTLKLLRGLHFGIASSELTDEFVPDDGELTFMGIIMDALPIDIRAARLIVLGYVFSVLDECVIIAAGLTVQKVFIDRGPETYHQKLRFADGSGSDLIAILNAYRYWHQNHNLGRFLNEETKREILYNDCLDNKGLHEMFSLIAEIKERLKQFNLDDTESVERVVVLHHERHILLKICIAGAFYPNFFLGDSTIKDEETERAVFHSLNNRDPCNTVYFTKVEPQIKPLLYQNQIKMWLKHNKVILMEDDVKVSVEKGAQKVFLTFLGRHEIIDASGVEGASQKNAYSDWVPGRIRTEIYKVLKLARSHEKLKLQVVEPEKLPQILRENERKNEKIKMYEDLCVLPHMGVESILGSVTCICHPNKFWFRPMQNGNEQIYALIREALDTMMLTMFTERSELIGKVVGVRLRKSRETNPRIHRAKILSQCFSSQSNDVMYQVCLIDEGEEIVVRLNQMFRIDQILIHPMKLGPTAASIRDKISLADIPPRVFEASLSEVKPSYVKSSAGKWTQEAVRVFEDFCSEESDVGVKAVIYSIWNGVVALELFFNSHLGEARSLNKHLCNLQLGQKCEENYPSKYNQIRRHMATYFPREPRVPFDTEEVEAHLEDFYEQPPQILPQKKDLRKIVIPQGPMSPLQISLYGPSQATKPKDVSVDQQSVNSVFLDSDPHDSCQKMVVAAEIMHHAMKQELVLRNTSLMPSIPGFAVIMAMLFAPEVEVHREETLTRFGNVLCGLGYRSKIKKSGKEKCFPLLQEHDISIRFDVNFNEEDIGKINKLRYFMSSLLHTACGNSLPNLIKSETLTLRKDVKREILNLLQQRRYPVETLYGTNDEKWGGVPKNKNDYYELSIGTMYGKRAIFPSFGFNKLEVEKPETVDDYRDNHVELNSIAFGTSLFPLGGVRCRLCSKTLMTVSQLQIHLLTSLHKERAKQNHASFDVQQLRPQQRVVRNSMYNLFSS